MLLVDDNSLTGSLADFCEMFSPEVFIADCPAKVECGCCTMCCQEGGPECSDEGLLAEYDPSWEDSYERPAYNFGNLTFV